MQPQRGRRSAFATTLSYAFLLPTLACAAQTDAAQTNTLPETEPAVAAAPAEAGPTNGNTAVAAFAGQETEAGRVLAAAMADARGTDRLLFVHSGADW